MRFTLASAFAISTLFLGALAAPTGADVPGTVSSLTSSQTSQLSEVSTEKTTTVTKEDSVCTVIQTLYTNVEQHTATINKTVAAIPENCSDSDKQSALIVIKAEIQAIASLVLDASVQISKININANIDVSAVVTLVIKLVFEIVCTLQGVIAVLGGTITTLLGSVIHVLVNAIVSLLLALQDILGGVIASVWAILSGVLPFVGDILVNLGDVLKGDCGCIN